jgi:hypothetical protein
VKHKMKWRAKKIREARNMECLLRGESFNQWAEPAQERGHIDYRCP